MADRDNYRGYGEPTGRYAERGQYERGGRDRNDRDGGFFERAGEQVRSWFSDDDDHRRDQPRSDREPPRHQDQERDRGYGYGGMMSGQRDRGREDRDFRSPQGGRSEPWGGGRDERDTGSQYSTGRFGGGGAGMGGNAGYGTDQNRSHPHDEHYHEMRRQHLDELDRDYHEYRQENRERFQTEFGNWRGQRQQQRSSVRQVKEHMDVVGSDGQPVGTVDKVAGDKIILTKTGPGAEGHHHSIPCSWLQSVDDKVTINKTAEQARQKWTDEENRRALFESEDKRRDDGPHILDRSFSGTYER